MLPQYDDQLKKPYNENQEGEVAPSHLFDDHSDQTGLLSARKTGNKKSTGRYGRCIEMFSGK
jgi:hypothetical protein